MNANIDYQRKLTCCKGHLLQLKTLNQNYAITPALAHSPSKLHYLKNKILQTDTNQDNFLSFAAVGLVSIVHYRIQSESLAMFKEKEAINLPSRGSDVVLEAILVAYRRTVVPILGWRGRVDQVQSRGRVVCVCVCGERDKEKVARRNQINMFNIWNNYIRQFHSHLSIAEDA